LLYDEKISSVGNKQRVATVVAHELAHQWFGNLGKTRYLFDLSTKSVASSASKVFNWERNVRPQIHENWTRLQLLFSNLWPNELQQMLHTSKLNNKLTRCSDLFSDDGLVVGPVA
jgi:hypothetical protein